MNRRLIPFVAAGWAMIAVGVVGVLTAGRQVPVIPFAQWVIGLALVHDLILAPGVIAAGVVVRAVVPASARAVVTRLLLVSGAFVLVAWPFVAGWGRMPDNPSLLPRDYAEGLARAVVIAAGLVLVGALVPIAYRRWRPRSRERCP